MLLARYPRVRLAHLPTPLEPMTNLSRDLGGPTLWVERDDCTGLGGGGKNLVFMHTGGLPGLFAYLKDFAG